MAIIRSDVEIHWSSELEVFYHYFFSGVELNSKEDNFEWIYLRWVAPSHLRGRPINEYDSETAGTSGRRSKRRHSGSWIHPKGSDEFSLIRTGEEERRPDLINLNDTSGTAPAARHRTRGNAGAVTSTIGESLGGWVRGSLKGKYACTDMLRGFLLRYRGISGVRRRRGINELARGRASEVSDGWREGARVEKRTWRTHTLESVNEIHAIGLYDKCRARYRVKGKPSSRSFQMRKGMAPFAGCENVNRWKRRVKYGSQIYQGSEGDPWLPHLTHMILEDTALIDIYQRNKGHGLGYPASCELVFGHKETSKMESAEMESVVTRGPGVWHCRERGDNPMKQVLRLEIQTVVEGR
ncbi:hypothetical protein EDB87DRAFT_1576689 [Lactarius vividus]|nr:hypothetical protein EDB87DRAFT_1576689 [Lactarius vividus]